MDDFIDTGSGGGIGFGLCEDITHAVIDEEIITSPRRYHTITESKNGEGATPIKTDKGYNLIVVKDESVGITEADCPDKICISEGFVSKPGATVVCLPHKVLVEVKSAGGDEPDVIPAH